MSRSDNTTKAERPAYAYPRPRDFKKQWRSPRTRGRRRAEHMLVSPGREPAPEQHRHGALWAAF